MMQILLGGGAVWLFLLIFGCALLSSAVADSKGRSGFIWFFAGLLFNVLGLIAIAGMPSLLHVPNSKTHDRCPDCKEFVFKEAVICKCCGHDLTGNLSEEQPGMLARIFG